MKTFNLFEKLWNHSRTLRRVGLVLVMCLITITHAYADNWYEHNNSSIVYFNDYNTNWVSDPSSNGIAFLMGRDYKYNNDPTADQGSRAYRMTHIDHTRLWYASVASWGTGNSAMYQYIAFRFASGTTGWNDWQGGWDNRPTARATYGSNTKYSSTRNDNITGRKQYYNPSSSDSNTGYSTVNNGLLKYTAYLRVRFDEDRTGYSSVVTGDATWAHSVAFDFTGTYMSTDYASAQSTIYNLSKNCWDDGGTKWGYADIPASGEVTFALKNIDSNYELYGWAYDESDATTPAYTTNPTNVTFNVLGNTSYVAFIRRKQFTVTYHTDGKTGGSAPSAETVLSGNTTTVKDNTGLMVKTGKVFAGWATSSSRASSGTIDYAPGATTSAITANLDLYPVWTNGSYLFSMVGSGSNGTLNETDFITQGTGGVTNNSAQTINGVTFSKSYYTTSGNQTTNLAGGGVGLDGKVIVYDAKTTQDIVRIYVKNTHTSSAYIQYLVIKEGTSVTSTDTVKVTLASGATKLINVDMTNTKGARLAIASNQYSKMYFTQIIAIEKGSTLPAPGASGYELASCGRLASASGSINGMAFSIGSTPKFGGTTKIKLSSTSHYFQFTTSASVQLQVKISANKHFYVCTDKSNAATTGQSYGGSSGTTYNINLGPTGTYYLTGNDGDLTIDKIAFADYVDATAPSAFASTATTSTSVTLSITDGTNSKWEIYYSTSSTPPTASTAATVSNITSKTPTVTGLTAGTDYYMWVRSVADYFNKSSWVALTSNPVSIDAVSCEATANAGADKSTTVGVGVTMAATAATSGYTGAWSIKTGSPSTSTSQLSSTSAYNATFTPTASGTYTLIWTVTDDSDGSCYDTDEAEVTVTKNTPTSYTVSGGGTLCSGGDADITLSGSQSGISYQLYNGASTVGDAVSGTGSALTWADQDDAGTYTVKTVANTTYSAATMSGSATIAFYDDISIGTQPTTPVAATVGSACSITGLVAAGTSPTYQWQTCNSDGSSATNITAAGAMSFTGYTTATLGLTPTAAGATYYKCVVSGSCGDPVTSNVVTVNASAAPTLYTITYNANGGTCKASDTQASEGAAITLATPTTTNDSTFKGWYIKGELITAATYRPTSDVTAYALWHKNCAGGGGGEPTVLFSQNFGADGAGSVAYTENTARSYTKASGLTGIVGNADNLFTSITCTNGSNAGMGINTSSGQNSADWTGKFGWYANSTGREWSICRTNNFASSAPTALKVEMNAAFTTNGSGSDIAVQFAIGSGFSDGLTTTCPALNKCFAGFAIPGNSTLRIAKYATTNGNTAIDGSSTTITSGTSYKYTWIINNTNAALPYTDPAGNENSVAAGCWDLWIGTSRNLAGISQSTTGMSGNTLQNIYIGSPFGKKGLFVLDDVTITDITPAGGGATCWHVTYLGGTGVDGGYVVDAAAYANNASATVKTNSNPGFTRAGYNFNGWQDGAGNSFTAGGSITMTKDTTLIAQWTSAVCAAPTITAQTEIQEIDLGERPEFSITATGAGSYQWYTCGADGSGEVVIDGATSSTYSPVAPTVVGTSYYKCKAIASCDASYVTYSDVIPCVVSPTNFTIHYETNTSTSSTNYDIEHFTQTKEVNSEVTSYITSLTNFAKTSGIAISDKAKTQDKVVTMSGKISVLAAYDENEYLSYTFTVANNYYLSIDSIDIRCQPVGGDNRNFKVVLTDALGTTITGNISTTTGGVLNRIPFTSAELNGKKLVGTVTVKIYGWYTSADTYRLARHSYIYGKVSSLPAPTASWTAHPASATVDDGGKTYTLTTDGTNTVAWSITDQSGATGAALSPTSGLTTTLDDYSVAGSLYVQASVTGDGIHYLSTPATLLRQRVVISAGCVETTLISATLSSCTGTGAVTGTPGGTSAVAFESCESLDGGYKMGKDGSYMRLALADGNFAANDEVKITITKASDQGDGALHIYKYASSTWTELGSVTAAGAGTYSYTLTETNVSTAFNTIGLYRTGKNQNPYVKALSVVRSSCSASKPSSVTVTASPAGPYAIGATPTLTVTATSADTYQWYSNTNNTASDGFLLVGETATTYSPSTAIAGTTYYYCVATNASGSTVSNIITVTVNSAKSTPTVSWTDTDDDPNYGGGGYAVKATVSTAEWDGTLTTDMLTASDGVTLTDVSVSGKVITATYGVTETARSPLSFSLTLPETTNYTALAANKEITFDRCGEGAVIETTETKLPVKSSYTTASNPTYRWETAEVGWLTLVTGSSTLSSTSDSYSGFAYRSSSGKSSITFYSELDAVSAVRIYIKGGGSTTLSKVQKGTTFGKYTQLAPSTDYDYSYSNGSSSIESREQGYIEITFKTALSANTFVEITLSRNTEYYGVGLITGNSEVGNITTALSWADPAPSATVNKTTTDANFRYEAVKASDAASQATLGTISYKSSVPAVATVSATGVVDILSEGSTRITATLAGSGCYKKATLSYNLVVAAATCTDVAGTITASGSGITIDGNTVTKTDACANVTLTVSGHTGEDAGATYQWYKDGVSMGESYRSKSISVTDNGDYTVEVTNTGGVHCTMPATNTITITGNAISITKIVDEWYVKNGRRTPDIALATIEGTTSWKVNDGSADIWVVSDGVASTTTGFGGCQFELRDGIVYLKGTKPDGAAPSGLAAGDVTLTITAVRDCSGESPNVSIMIHKQGITAKPSVAFIVDGTSGDPVNSVATTKTSSRPIWIYLSESFDLTGCNAYWTNNEKLIRQYYSQFDAIVITDDPSTGTGPKSGLKYVNALGTMVDVRPILTMEAYVGKYGASSNWHIGGTPSSPNPRQYELKLQCKDHDIFSDLTPSANFRSEEIDGETYYYVTMVDNSVTPYAGLADDAETETYPALQGFSAASIKGTGMLGIGTISDGTLQGGVERQDEPTARMMILGIQHQAMAALTSEGKQVIKNAINYLLKTDMEEVDDCSNYFIGGTVGHEQEWHTASNWSSTKVPDASTKARIMAPVTISTTVHVAQVDIATGGTSIHYKAGSETCGGSVTIAPTGALIVDGQVRRTTNGRLYTEDELQPTTPADLTIQTSPSAQGALIFDNSDGETQATVVVHSSANKAGSTRNWQYLTSPLQETPVTEFFYGVGTYTYKHSEADGGWVRYNLGTAFNAFDAIGLTQEAAKDFVFYGPLAPTGEWELNLTNERSGNNLFGNSWTAPIDLKALVNNTDFDSNIELDLAIYNTGADKKNGEGEFDQATNADNTPGTWHHIPLYLATLDGGGWTGMTVIPAYQAFQLKATAAATLTIDYDKCVRSSESENYTEPLRSPGHRAAGKSNSDIEALRLAVSDAKGIAYIYLLEGEQFTEGYDNGWELEYKPNSKYGKLYAISPEQGDMMALARPSLEGTMVGFQPGESSEYTITFNETDGYYYLNDLKMEQSTLIQAGESYTFSVEEGESANRFLISSVPFNKPGIVTGVTNLETEAPKAQKVIYNDKLYIIRGGKVFSADGQLVK